MTRSVRPALLATTVLVLASGCGGSAAKSGETVIEGPLADEIGLGELTATCSEPDDLEEGQTFGCTAETGDGRTITFEAVLTSDDEFDIVTSNLFTSDEVDSVAADAARALAEQVGTDIPVELFSCPEGVAILDDDDTFACEIEDPISGAIYELTVTATGWERGSGFSDVEYGVSDEPIR
jgi:hypothetical protein